MLPLKLFSPKFSLSLIGKLISMENPSKISIAEAFFESREKFSFSPYWTSIAVELRREMFLVYSFYCNLSVINC
jgi:hypothetical protein